MPEFHPAVKAWFERQFGEPTEPQALGWPAIQSGRHTLIAAPTGSGKTLAAFLAELDCLFQEALGGQLQEETRVVYISPLKALSNDIHKNLEIPLAGIREEFRRAGLGDFEIRSDLRTGDTPASKRLAIGRRPPHVLVTTPESFYLLLTSESGRRVLRTVRTAIVDEVHALVGNRRGSHLSLSLERLDALAGRSVQRIGLSATQKPIEEVARFLVGMGGLNRLGEAECAVIDAGHRRTLDLAIEIPESPLEAVMSNEVWEEVYGRVAELIGQHRTTLVFVNTRRLAERVTHHLSERLGENQVMSHHGSLSAKLRLEAENRLKRGDLKALVATASLELGIDIGAVDLVCQLGSTRSIATLLQRVGRAEHKKGGLPKGRLFPLTRDELVECTALLRSVRAGELDRLEIPSRPIDVLAQQIVACAACEDWEEARLFELVRRAYPYRGLSDKELDDVLQMLAEGFSTRRGRRGALIHRDAVNRRIRGRRGARLIALTSGGAIPDNADYRVVVDPADTFIGTVNEDFAVESMAGDIFQLGNTSWRILRVNAGVVRVEDAQGQPPGLPFWLGEAPARTAEVSHAVSDLRAEIERRLAIGADFDWLTEGGEISRRAASQIYEYYRAVRQVLGVIPTQGCIVMERFFDESGGMQLVIHSPYGNRINRAWGLALRKRFCRKFNFELQAAATDDAIVLSLGTQHSFPLEEVFRYLHAKSVRDLLVQALLDAPMFTVRWRWNVNRSLAVPRHRSGRRVAPPLQRMEAEDLLAAVFPDQVACLEHIVGDRQIPDHPLVNQTIEDCLVEAMDIDGLVRLLEGIERGSIRCVARDLPEPSPLAQEILHARPYAFLDNAPLEERRTQAVYSRRAGQIGGELELGKLDPAAIATVRSEAWPAVENADELHDLLLGVGLLPEDKLNGDAGTWFEALREERRAAVVHIEKDGRTTRFWIAAERRPLVEGIYVDPRFEPNVQPPGRDSGRRWERSEALRELVRGQLEVLGPVTVPQLAGLLAVTENEITTALAELEGEGFVMRGRFDSNLQEMQWCQRRLLARIHRLTIHRLRAEIQPVSLAEFGRFLMAWQHVASEQKAHGIEGLAAVLELLDGFEAPAAAWEPEILSLRVSEYDPRWLDRLTSSGRVGWGRLSARTGSTPLKGPAAPVRSSPISLFQRDPMQDWLELSRSHEPVGLSHEGERVYHVLHERGAQFFGELARLTGLLPSLAEQGLAELVAFGLATCDSFEGLRALLIPAHKRTRAAANGGLRRRKTITSVEFAGRWSLLRSRGNREEAGGAGLGENGASAKAFEAFAGCLLKRYGVVFRKLLGREMLAGGWFELSRVYRRWEARGEIRGGYFVQGVSGEQFALPEAIESLRALRKEAPREELVAISGADPLNLTGMIYPGRRISGITNNRVLLCDGVPIAGIESGEIVRLAQQTAVSALSIERALVLGKLPVSLRPYYG